MGLAQAKMGYKAQFVGWHTAMKKKKKRQKQRCEMDLTEQWGEDILEQINRRCSTSILGVGFLSVGDEGFCFLLAISLIPLFI
jgi:hypothetical protein